MKAQVKQLEIPTLRVGQIQVLGEVQTAQLTLQISIQTKMECQMVGKFSTVVGLVKRSMVAMIGHLIQPTQAMRSMMLMVMG